MCIRDRPLTDVPDPFEKYNSFGEHNNEKLKKFLNNFNFKYNFKSSTQLYKSGFFNPTLQIILDNYDGIMNIIMPTLGKERQKTYCPFLPICPETGHVLEIPVKKIDNSKSKIVFDNKGKDCCSKLLLLGIILLNLKFLMLECYHTISYKLSHGKYILYNTVYL